MLRASCGFCGSSRVFSGKCLQCDWVDPLYLPTGEPRTEEHIRNELDILLGPPDASPVPLTHKDREHVKALFRELSDMQKAAQRAAR